VLPTVHYNMGGVPTNYHGEVIKPKVRSGHRAARCCCVSLFTVPPRLPLGNATSAVVMSMHGPWPAVWLGELPPVGVSALGG
jgi:succinate dehydrogenase/fumarate reductase flavoprotein subunit